MIFSDLEFCAWIAGSLLAGMGLVYFFQRYQWRSLARQYKQLAKSQDVFLAAQNEHRRRQEALISDERELAASWKKLNEQMEKSNGIAREVIEERGKLLEDQRNFRVTVDTYTRLREIAKAARDHCRGDEDGARLSKLLDETRDPELMYTR